MRSYPFQEHRTAGPCPLRVRPGRFARFQQWFVGGCALILLLTSAWELSAAAVNEKGAFAAGVEAFQDGFYQQAEKSLGEYIRQSPTSPRVAEAALLQAQARIRLGNLQGAILLLSSGVNQAGTLGDEYLFWLAEAQARTGDYAVASDTLGRLQHQFPASVRCLEAVVKESTMRANMSDWPKVASLLQDTNGVFQTAVRAGTTNDFIARGQLLLGEARFAAQDLGGAEAALSSMAALSTDAEMAWRREHLLARIHVAANRLPEALQSATNMVSLANRAGNPTLQAESASMHAGLLERTGKPDDAIAVYSQIIKEGVPPEKQLETLLKISDLLIAQNNQTNLADAAFRLERFCASNMAVASIDKALLTLGEIRLRQHLSAGDSTSTPANTNAAVSTNTLQLAMEAFSSLLKTRTNSPLVGKAQLDLGWCFWHQGMLAESQSAFQAAVERLPAGSDLATAYIKLGDTQFRLNQFLAAMTNYEVVVEKFADSPEVRSNLLEGAIYQLVRASVAGGAMDKASNAVARLLAWYPTGSYTEKAVLLAGQELTRRGEAPAARELINRFLTSANRPSLLPDLRLALARTYERESKWQEAIQEYDGWLNTFTNSKARPQAEYSRAWAQYQAGNETNAFNYFTNFVASYPGDQLAPLAQWWVADFYFKMGLPGMIEAEKNYELLYQYTNQAPPELKYQAGMMAGRAAVARQGWKDATRYFTNLTSDLNCPADLKPQAMFAYADTLMSQDSTNKMADYELAIQVLSQICESYPSNRLAVLALGQKANCLLQWSQYDQGTNALNAFAGVIGSPLADFTARSIARVGTGVVLEKQAQGRNGSQREALLESALGNYLDVFYYEKDLREGEKPDLFWVKKAGLEAGRVTEAMQKWDRAANVYQRLQQLIPALSPSLEKRIQRAQENLGRPKT